MLQKPDWLSDYDYAVFLQFCIKYDVDPKIHSYEETVEKVLVSMEIAMEMRNI